MGYPCDLCKNTAASPNNLKRHKESKPEGVTFPCDKCDYAPTKVNSLKQHKDITIRVFQNDKKICELYFPIPRCILRHPIISFFCQTPISAICNFWILPEIRNFSLKLRFFIFFFRFTLYVHET